MEVGYKMHAAIRNWQLNLQAEPTPKLDGENVHGLQFSCVVHVEFAARRRTNTMWQNTIPTTALES